MSIDLTSEQDTLSAFFHTFTLRVERDGITYSSPCSLDVAAPQSGAARREDGADVERATYVIELPARSTLELRPGEWVTIDEKPGRRYQVSWAPGVESFNLGVAYTVTEAR